MTSLPTGQQLSDHVALDSETNGLDRHDSNVHAVGYSVATTDGRGWYLPIRHVGGGNLDEQKVLQWMRKELCGKKISFVNPSFDMGMALKDGVDLESMGCVPRGVQYYAALIDERNRDFSLDGMAQRWLGKQKRDQGIDPKLISEYHASMVSDYAIGDAQLTMALDQAFQPLLAAEELTRVAQLEDDLIYPTFWMENQGVYLDVPKMERWQKEVRAAYQDSLKFIDGVNVNSGKQLETYFRRAGMGSFNRTAIGKSSFTEENLLQYWVENPGVQKEIDAVLKVRALRSIDEKYISKYLEAVDAHGLLRYHLHQCRADDKGTVSGRYSSSNVNIQQVSAEEKQDPATAAWIIRELFIPSHGGRWFSADASQIEFRLFAHFANATNLIRAYVEHPDTDFHQWVSDETGIIRKKAKNLNFLMVYGGGIDKFCRTARCSREDGEAFFHKYNRKFPEARQIARKAMRLAKDRGYVKTLLGRRRRFPNGHMIHAALNGVLQGSAADIMKQKLIEVYRNMKHLEINMRFTVHDEIDGDCYNPTKLKDLAEILNTQSFDLRVPITWEVDEGENWRLLKEAA